MNAEPPTRRFVLLRHELPEDSPRASHFDLMLERDEDLLTLELLEPLAVDESIPARELAPNRKAYIDYEGPISAQRGSVARVDRGDLTVIAWSEDRIEADLDGVCLRGRLILERDVGPGGERSANWRATLLATS